VFGCCLVVGWSVGMLVVLDADSEFLACVEVTCLATEEWELLRQSLKGGICICAEYDLNGH